MSKSYTFSQLDERGQQNAVNLYYADDAYQQFIEDVQKVNPYEFPTVGDWACEAGIRFTEHGERIA